MLATMESVTIMQFADTLAGMVLQSEAGDNYRLSLYKMQNDREAQQKIRAFASLKDLYEEVQRFGKYHLEYKRVNLEIRELKRAMDLHPTIADFKRAETEIQGILDEISMKIGHAVSPNIKVPSGNPFFDSLSSCSGGCGSGGGCSCSA
ncbi:YlbF family regulator [Bacillus sp. V59.32b]|uniref:YlbF family regulator n=1 Tax=Bacillus sp. V59.32b TaxID=1758642 RepID=UPI000E3CA747|nr:YlbF family regulator [Bacillus sp. V59.32b]RFU61172.1 YlbF family regulator [Bacillus sp. V59.32b]